MTKYHARPAVIDGIRFASNAEGNRYRELRLMEQAGKISDLELQPRFVFVKPYTRRDGTKSRGVTYVADFRYLDNGTNRITVEDVKGFETQAYKIKKTLLFWFYPDINFVEIKGR